MKRLIILTVLILALLGGTASATVTGYRYYIRVDIHNTGTVEHDTRIVFEIDSQELIDEGYIQADGDDIQMVNDVIVPTSLDHNNSQWYIDYVTLPPGGQLAKNIWIGSPTAVNNQVWIGGPYDWTQANDSNSLDIDASTGIRVSANIEVCESPNTGSKHYILAKQGAYELYLDGTPSIVFRVYDGGQAVASGSDVFKLDDSCLSDGDLTTSCGGGGATYDINYKFGTPPAVIPLGANVTSATLYARVKNCTASNRQIDWWLGDSDLNDDWHSFGNTSIPNGCAWVWVSKAIPPEHGGTYHTVNDFFNRYDQARFKTYYSTISEWSLRLVYNWEPGTPHSVSIPIQENINYDIVGEYSGGDVSLTVGGTNSTTAGAFGNINTNTDYLIVGGFRGYLDNCIVAYGTPSYSSEVLNLTFEPDLINPGSITDTSGSDNHVGYTFPTMDTDITTTISKINPYNLSIYYLGSTGTGSGVNTPIPWFTATPTYMYPPDDSVNDWNGMPGASFINHFVDDLDIPRSAFWLCFFASMLLGATFFLHNRTHDVVGVGMVVVGIFIFQRATSMGVGDIDILMISLFYISLYVRREISVGRL